MSHHRYVSKVQYDGKCHATVRNSSGDKCDLGGFETAEEASLAAALTRTRTRTH